MTLQLNFSTFKNILLQMDPVLVAIPTLAGLVSVGVLTRYLTRNRRLPNGPPGELLYGNLKSLSDRNLHIKAEEWYRKYGQITKLKIGSENCALVNTAEMIKEVFVDNSEVTNWRQPYRNTVRAFGDQSDILVTNGDKWSKHHNFFIKMLKTHRRQNIIAETARDESQRFIQQLQSEPIFEVQSEMMNITFNVLTRLMIGRILTESEKRLLKSLQDEFPGPGLHEMIQFPGSGYFFSKHKRDSEVDRLMQDVDLLLLSFIDDADIPEDCFVGYMNNSDLDRTTKMGLLMDMFVAGYDSIQFHTTWFLLLLAMHPEVQDKLYEELSTGKRDYFNMTLREVIRYRPILFSGTWRRAQADIELSNGQMIPKGWLLMYNTWHVHHSDFWQNPEQFNPERFRDISISDETMHTLGFFRGPRTCPGKDMAKDEIYEIISAILKEYKLVAPDGDILNDDTYYSDIMRKDSFRLKAVTRTCEWTSERTCEVENSRLGS